MSPLGAVARGLIAAAAGTAAMDTQQYLQYRSGSGTKDILTWEFGGISSWDDVSTPGQVGKRIAEAWTGRPLSPRWAQLTNNLMHWGFGVQWGLPFGLVAGSTSLPAPVLGPPFGAAVWLFGYAVLPLGGFYQPLWAYDARTLARDLFHHVLYGAVTGITFEVLSPKNPDP
jgi:hypothetical protein